MKPRGRKTNKQRQRREQYETPRGALGTAYVRLELVGLRVSQTLTRYPLTNTLLGPVIDLVKQALADVGEAIEWLEKEKVQ